MSFWEPRKKYSDYIAVIDKDLDHSFSYKELYEDAESITEIVNQKEKKLILLMVDNSYLSLVFYIGILLSDHAAILLNQDIDSSFLAEIVDIYKPYAVFSKKDTTCLDRDYSLNSRRMSSQNYILYMRKKICTDKIHPGLSIMLSTSGSTGSSKFIRLSKKNLAANTSSIIEYLKIVGTDNAITSLPLHYSFGLSVINTHLEAGATLTCTNSSIVEKNFWETFNHFKCNTFSGVPYTFQILEKMRFDNIKLSTLRYFTQAGGHLNSKTKKYFLNYVETNNNEFIVMYGQTEATARISYVPYEFLSSKIDSIGIPIPGGKLKIFNDKEEIEKAGEIGELVYFGDNVMMGYAESRKRLNKDDELKGILSTGDLGYMDEDGFYYITGRKKRFIKVYGNRVSLDDVERILETHFNLTFAVTGIDDNLYIILEDIKDSDTREISSFVNSKMGLHHTCMKFKCLEKIPLTRNGKKDYSAIKEIFENSSVQQNTSNKKQ